MSVLGDTKLETIKQRCEECEGNCAFVGCEYVKWCRLNGVVPGSLNRPRYWNLADPPRFTDEQMAFWKMWFDMGATTVTQAEYCLLFDHGDDWSVGRVDVRDRVDWLEDGETLDLAEMFGKEGTK